ncbi:hypothetical protein LTR47_000452 [Exophiala xenobiotica]|nr:hypothetical protein LTR41_004228 [Exophiala xenobiotica]KAK5238709.1 hypothetical protein LTR47_000452 [Exophiala xenobiotica]KAK5255630.1 hypothetical protein LTS06_000086 [Exophiala xenobiotica]KAK5262581.1 hypothetical protein LTR40_000087 [Exophiala xenobiotica]KAK5315005.1 hypothetical protein LTR93_010007 [Exophiala xenobiotica]
MSRDRLDEENVHRIQSQPATRSNRKKILLSASGQKIVYIDIDPSKRDSNALLMSQYRGMVMVSVGHISITGNASKWQEGKA